MSAAAARARSRRGAALAAVLVLGCELTCALVVGASGAAEAAADPTLDVGAVNRGTDGTAWLVAAVQPPPGEPLARSAARLTVAGQTVPTVLAPVLTREAAIVMVLDASAQGPIGASTAALSDAGDARAGAAAFMQQLPPDAQYAVVADCAPPDVASPLSLGSAAARKALATVQPQGRRSTSQALTVALRQLPAWPLAQPVIVVYTSAADAGGESVSALSVRLVAAHAVLAVIATASDSAYWDRVAAATGGFTISVGPPGPIGAFAAAADALRSRYVVTASLAAASSSGDASSRPAAPEAAQLAITVGSRAVTSAVSIPAAVATPAAAEGQGAVAAPSPTSSSSAQWWTGAGSPLGLIAAAAAIALGTAIAVATPRAVTQLRSRSKYGAREYEPAEIAATLLPQHQAPSGLQSNDRHGGRLS